MYCKCSLHTYCKDCKDWKFKHLEDRINNGEFDHQFYSYPVIIFRKYLRKLKKLGRR